MTKMKKRMIAGLLALVMCTGVISDTRFTFAEAFKAQETAYSLEQKQSKESVIEDGSATEAETKQKSESATNQKREITIYSESNKKSDADSNSAEDTQSGVENHSDKGIPSKVESHSVRGSQTEAEIHSDMDIPSEIESHSVRGSQSEADNQPGKDNQSEAESHSGKDNQSEAESHSDKDNQSEAEIHSDKDIPSETERESAKEDPGTVFEDPICVGSDYTGSMKLDSLDGEPVPLDEENIYNLEYNSYDIPINYCQQDTRWAKNIYVAYCSVSPDNFRPNDITYLEEMMDPGNDELFGTRRSMGYGSLYDLGELNQYYAVYTGASRRNSRDVDGYALYALVDGKTVELSGSVFDARADLLLIPYEVYDKYADYNLFVTMVQIRDASPKVDGDAFYTGNNSLMIRLQTSPGSTAEAQYSFTTNSDDQTMYWGGHFINPKTGDEVGGSGSYLYRYKAKSADGTLMKMTFCLEPGAHLYTGDQLSNNQGHIKWNKLTTDQKDSIRYIIYKYAHHSLDVDCNNDEKWVACQALIWEIAMEIRNPETFTRTSSRVYDSYLAHRTASRARAAYTEMADHIKDHADRIKTTSYEGEFDFYATASRQLIFAGTSITNVKAGIKFEITKKTDTATDSKNLVAASSMYSLKGAEYSAYEIPDVTSITDAKTKGYLGRDKSDPSSASTNSSGVAELTLPTILDQDHRRAAFIIYETASSPYYRLDRTVYLLYLYFDTDANKINYYIYSIPWSARKTATSSTWTTYKDQTTISTTAVPKTTVYETPKRFALKLKKKLKNTTIANAFADNYSLKDAEYQVWYSDSTYAARVKYKTYKTDASGNIDFGELPMHQAYYIQEISPSYGCELDPTIYLVHLDDGDNDGYYYYCKYSNSTNSSGNPVWKNAEGYVADDGSTLEKSATITKTITVTSEEPVMDFTLKLIKESTGTGIAGTTYSRAGAIYTIYAVDKPESDSNRSNTFASAVASVSGSTNMDKLAAASAKGKAKVLGSVKTDAEGKITKTYTGADGSGTEKSATSITLPLTNSNANPGNGQFFFMIETTPPAGYIRSDRIYALAAWCNSSKVVTYNVYSSLSGTSWAKITDTTEGTIATVTAEDDQIELKVLIKKESLNPAYTDGDKADSFSLAGAEYTLYYGTTGASDQKVSEAWAVKKKVSTASIGDAFTLEFNDLTPIKQVQGYYFIQETKPGKGYDLDPKIYGISVRAGEEPETVTYRVYSSETGDSGSFKTDQEVKNVPSGSLITITSVEPPVYAPPQIDLVKYDKETGMPVQVVDDDLTAVFQLEYFATNDAIAEDKTPDKTWRFKTDISGSMPLDKAHLDTTFKNSDLTYNEAGVIIFPEGTYRLKEVKAPDGYTLEEGIMLIGDGGNYAPSSNFMGYDVQKGILFTIKKDEYRQPFIYYEDDHDATGTGASQTIHVENLSLSAYDEMDKCSVKIIKYMQGTKKTLPGVTFKLVSEKGEEYIKTTDSKGEILFEELKRGMYTLTETDAPDGVQLLKESVTIELPVTMTEEEVKKGNVDTNKAYTRMVKDADGKEVVQYVFRDITYKVGNSYNMDMPMTGGNDSRQMLIGLLGLLLVLGVCWKGRKTWNLSK